MDVIRGAMVIRSASPTLPVGVCSAVNGSRIHLLPMPRNSCYRFALVLPTTPVYIPPTTTRRVVLIADQNSFALMTQKILPPADTRRSMPAN